MFTPGWQRVLLYAQSAQSTELSAPCARRGTAACEPCWALCSLRLDAPFIHPSMQALLEVAWHLQCPPLNSQYAYEQTQPARSMCWVPRTTFGCGVLGLQHVNTSGQLPCACSMAARKARSYHASTQHTNPVHHGRPRHAMMHACPCGLACRAYIEWHMHAMVHGTCGHASTCADAWCGTFAHAQVWDVHGWSS